jgi:hypothetical protein
MVDAASQALARLLLDGTGAQAWIEYIRRRAAEAAARTAAASSPDQQTAAEDTPGSDEQDTPEPDAAPDPQAALRAARNAAFRDQQR